MTNDPVRSLLTKFFKRLPFAFPLSVSFHEKRVDHMINELGNPLASSSVFLGRPILDVVEKSSATGLRQGPPELDFEVVGKVVEGVQWGDQVMESIGQTRGALVDGAIRNSLRGC
ncbi:hypothetical protein FOZ61_004709 [Perkinsus olseni]|uniref:Uncharacterized protein n=1 Tax=Perkinsus olseni TaxID=32597 RepID=A0A7J6LK43_PEROL|nr:hypothetical protein FOZ61_004709 [Perkinsus olseni]